MKRFSFGKDKRLTNDRQFKAVFVHNLRVSNGLLALYMAENDCGYPRLGVSVGKDCGCAVVRNRWKRLMREAFRQNQDRIPPSFDYLLMISPKGKCVKQPTFEQVENSFLALVSNAIEKIK